MNPNDILASAFTALAVVSFGFVALLPVYIVVDAHRAVRAARAIANARRRSL